MADFVDIDLRGEPDNVPISADINQLMENIQAVLQGTAPWKHITTPASPASGYMRLYVKSDNKVYKLTSAGVDTEVGGRVPAITLGAWNADGRYFPTTNPAIPETDTDGTYGNLKGFRFDDANSDTLYRAVRLPPSLTGYTKLYIEYVGYAMTAAASKVVEFIFSYSSRAAGETWKSAYTDVQLGVMNCDANQDELDFHSFAITDLSPFAGNDLMRIKITRDPTPTSGDNLPGDYRIPHIRLRLSAT